MGSQLENFASWLPINADGTLLPHTFAFVAAFVPLTRLFFNLKTQEFSVIERDIRVERSLRKARFFTFIYSEKSVLPTSEIYHFHALQQHFAEFSAIINIVLNVSTTN
jgi:hypothetical protein